MTTILEKLTQDLSRRISQHIERFGFGAAALILFIEFVWAASVLFPVLFMIGLLYGFTNAWMSVLPGLLGAVTFLILLTIAGFAATLPSTYLAKLREWAIERIMQRYPEPGPQLPQGFEIQDAD